LLSLNNTHEVKIMESDVAHLRILRPLEELHVRALSDPELDENARRVLAAVVVLTMEQNGYDEGAIEETKTVFRNKYEGMFPENP